MTLPKPAATSDRRPGFRLIQAALLALAALPAGKAAAEDYRLTARLDWRSQGEIHQVWFHREFDGLLLPIAPVAIGGDDGAVALLENAEVVCSAFTKVGLPNWSVATAQCALRTNGGVLTIAIACDGTHAQCAGDWRVVDGDGVFRRAEGGGETSGHLVDPMPLPWFWDGPIVGYTELRGWIGVE
jgi:hypothetical protein